MKRRALLHLDADGLSIWTLRRERLQALADFPNTAAGHLGFADFLAGRPSERYALLVDLPEETLQPIEIPRLGRRDRATLLARRLARHFPDTPLRAALPLGRDAAAPGSEQILLLALAAPSRVSPWLTQLAQAGIALGRLQTASQLAGPLLSRLGATAATALLVVCHRRGFRITALAAGHPRFSRLVANGAEPPAAAIAGEAGRLHRYLLDQRLHAPGQVLPAVVVAPAPLLAELAGRWPAAGQLALQPVDLASAAAGVGLATPTGEADSRAIQLQLLASCPPAVGIPTGAGPGRLPAAGLGRLLLAGGGAALAGALGFAAWQLQAAGLARDEARRLDSERVGLESRHPTGDPASPAQPIDAENLRRFSAIRATVARLQYQPGPAYLRLSRVLDRQPAIEIERIDWKILPAPGATADPLLRPIESTTLYGRLRAAPADFAAFVAALRADPAVALSIRQPPDETGQARGIPSPEFVVELQRSLAR